MYPDMVQTLVDGGYSQTSCPACGISIFINTEIMINSPKGIIMIPTGPLERLRKILHKLEIVDETYTPFSSQEIWSRLQHNLDNLEENPILKKQQEMQKSIEYPEEFLEQLKSKEKKKKKRFGLF